MQNPGNGLNNEVIPPVVPVLPDDEVLVDEREADKKEEVKPEDFKPFNLDAIEEMPDGSELKPND